MAKANERVLQIGKAFKEMQTAYGLAITSIPPDPEKNLWANEKIRVLERTISQSIVFLGEEEQAVDDLAVHCTWPSIAPEDKKCRIRRRIRNE